MKKPNQPQQDLMFEPMEFDIEMDVYEVDTFEVENDHIYEPEDYNTIA